MESENKTENVGKVVEKIHTKLKFVKSEQNGALISFISQNTKNGIVCGVRQDSPYPKKIVIVDREIANNIIVNMLYDCVLIPMGESVNKRTGEKHIPGYIAIEANPVQFKASVTTKYVRGAKYHVEVTFGNKTIRFDPYRGEKETTKSFNACRAVLEKRCDVKDLMDVVEDFTNAANALLETLKRDMREINNRKKRPNEKVNRGYRN